MIPISTLKSVAIIPADPEHMNYDRAKWAAVALTAFQDYTGTDAEDVLKDLLCDLMHWSDRVKEIDFDVALGSARSHYQQETQPFEMEDEDL